MKGLLTLVFFLAFVTLALAQPSNPTNPVPLDGGLSILLAAGGALGYKMYKNKKKED